MVLFQCDYNEGAHPRIIERLVQTNLEQTPGYGEDIYCQRAKGLIKEACGTPNADIHFMVGGTQTNATVISSILRPYQGVISADTGHINVHETGAIEHSGHKVLAVKGENGQLTAQMIENVMAEHLEEDGPEHTVQPGMVYISFPTEVGSIYSKRSLMEIRAVCDKYSLPLFIDGARLGYGLTSSQCDVSLKELAALADVFYIGGTKQGALFGEAVVICNESLKKDFRYHIKQNGGMLAKGRLLGLQFETLFTDDLYFKIAAHANVQALRIKEAFAAKGFEFLMDSPTNQQFPIVTEEQAAILGKDFGYTFWKRIDSERVAIRFCTSWATKTENVDKLVDFINNVERQ